MTNISNIDRYTIRHLDAWLDNAIAGDTRREHVRARMLAFIADDEEYWASQSWWNVYDHAKCDDIERDSHQLRRQWEQRT
jgi:hypothetical protein